tara:strand:- start:40 stop:558 length:519 start_codon:yes stop_codon:yes gene_type:complete
MKTKIFPIFILLLFIFTFLIFLKSLENTNIYTPNVKINKSIPLFETKLFDSDDFVNSNEIFKKDKFYLMNIWASWCVPCIEEHPYLLSLNNQKDIEIIGLNYKDDTDKAKKFLKKYNSPYKIILSDFDGSIAIEWGAYGVPETFVIFNNKIVKKFIGPLNTNSILEIKKLIK